MKNLALTATVFVLTATSTSVLAQQSDIEFLRSRADAHERKISQLERELNHLKSYHTDKQPPKAVLANATAANPNTNASEYVVKKGDMLGRIAKKHNTTVATLKQVNNLRNDNILIGQKLRIPSADQTATTTAATPAPQAQNDSRPLTATSTHVVKSGETLYSIARQHNIKVARLMQDNPQVNPKNMQVGQRLSIENGARPAAASARNTAATKASNNPKTLPKPKESAKVAEHVDPPKASTQNTKEVVRNAPADRQPVSQSAPQREPEIRTITVHKQITYGQFASQYGASTSQLNELNGLSLSKNTMLAIGSELYVPKD